MEITIVMLVLMFVTVGATSLQPGLSELVPSDASDVQHRSNGAQTDYLVVRQLDSPGVNPKGLSKFRQAGWTVCEAGKWDTFTDKSPDGSARRIRQRVTYLHRDGRLIGVSERYVGEVAIPKDTEPRRVTLISEKVAHAEIKTIIDSNRLVCN